MDLSYVFIRIITARNHCISGNIRCSAIGFCLPETSESTKVLDITSLRTEKGVGKVETGVNMIVLRDLCFPQSFMPATKWK